MPSNFPTSIRLERRLKAALTKVAKAQGCSLTWLIHDILAKWNTWRKQQDKK
jgi:predicted DNA-binding ribbon-helix-helix protein